MVRKYFENIQLGTNVKQYYPCLSVEKYLIPDISVAVIKSMT